MKLDAIQILNHKKQEKVKTTSNTNNIEKNVVNFMGL